MHGLSSMFRHARQQFLDFSLVLQAPSPTHLYAPIMPIGSWSCMQYPKVGSDWRLSYVHIPSP